MEIDLRSTNSNLAREPRKTEDEIKISKQVEQATAQLVANLADQVVSILYYSHPCRSGGLVMVFRDDAKCFVELISMAYQVLPPNILLHCFRQVDLFQLSLPLISGIDAVTSHLHLPFCIKHRSVLLYGEDVRSKIALTEKPSVWLNIHLEACAHSFRNTAILGLLSRRDYPGLITKLEWQVRCLMFTALLVRDEQQVNADTLPKRFAQLYPDEELQTHWNDLSHFLRAINGMDEAAGHQAAFEAAWLFESFLGRLRRYAR